jgi:hypothetical protein
MLFHCQPGWKDKEHSALIIPLYIKIQFLSESFCSQPRSLMFLGIYDWERWNAEFFKMTTLSDNIM